MGAVIFYDTGPYGANRFKVRDTVPYGKLSHTKGKESVCVQQQLLL